jgi:uncharacterized membrane protein YkoI
MRNKTKLLMAGAVLALGAAVPAIAQAGADSETPIPSSDIDRASAAAIDHLGGGRVTDTEVGDEESYYEVEVTLEDGGQVDVQLDESFDVVGTEDDRSENEQSDGD